jgi:hypothetical protein
MRHAHVNLRFFEAARKVYRMSTPRRYEIESLGAGSVLLLVGFLGVLAGVSV